MVIRNISKYKVTSFEWILIGITIYGFGAIFQTSHNFMAKVLVVFGLLMLVINAFLTLPTQTPFKGVFQSAFFFYLLWSLFVILHPLITGGSIIIYNISPMNPIGILSYFTPLIVFLGFKHLSLNSVFKFAYISGFIGIILFIINYSKVFTIEQVFTDDEYQEYIGIAAISITFLSTASYLILFHSFIPFKYKLMGFLSLLLYLITALYVARRGEVFSLLIILLFTLYLFVFSSKKGSTFFKFIFVLSVLAVGIASFYIYSGSTFNFFLLRFSEDTRSGVETLFLKGFEGRPLDWIIGRGISGTYYCPILNKSHRDMIETGYLHIILKGGIINLCFYVFFLLHSAYLGFFHSKNTLTKAMAFYLLAHVILLKPWGIPTFSIEYFIVWICILYCQSKIWRMKSDTFIKGYLNTF
jgi:hypothetical protein